jgi:hypothetical protein
MTERELIPLRADEAADDEYEAHLVGASSSGGSSDLLMLIVAANAMMIWPWVMPWYYWTQLFSEPSVRRVRKKDAHEKGPMRV